MDNRIQGESPQEDYRLPDGFAVLAERCANTALSAAVNVTGDWPAARRTVRIVLAEGARKKTELPPPHDFGRWLYLQARREALRERRREALPGWSQTLAEAAEVFLPGGAQAYGALGRVQEQDRGLFLLRELGGLGEAEIARTVNLTLNAVRVRLRRTERRWESASLTAVCRSLAAHRLPRGWASAIVDPPGGRL
ncbi:sigma factor-like helix-turn-helix DNA-binding protein [Paenibacillus sp. S-38]|uniref:sigma factor-like helix-turn-helix DNA-binding protein n=1 Tax=Paenibacillus sp. S-38 TaxID=3416710 RepID=UPI003CEE1E08